MEPILQIPVSIIVPCFNVEEYIKDTLDSLLSQTYSNFEIICLNDCSTDGTLHLLNKFALRDKRVKVFCNEYNMGIIATLNKLVELTKNELIIRTDADDISTKDRIEKLVESCLKSNADIVSSDYSLINESGNYIKKRGFDLLRTPAGIVYTAYFNSPLISQSLYKKTLFSSYTFREGYKAAEDYKFFTDVMHLNNLRIEVLPELLYKYRINSQGISISQNELQIKHHIKIARSFIEETLHLDSASFDYWYFIKRLYNLKDASCNVIYKSLNQIRVIRDNFVRLKTLTKAEMQEVEKYTTQYFFISYLNVLRTGVKQRVFFKVLCAISRSFFWNLPIFFKSNCLKWIIKNL